jgi:hypothetical protein
VTECILTKSFWSERHLAFRPKSLLSTTPRCVLTKSVLVTTPRGFQTKISVGHNASWQIMQVRKPRRRAMLIVRLVLTMSLCYFPLNQLLGLGIRFYLFGRNFRSIKSILTQYSRILGDLEDKIESVSLIFSS